MGVDAVVVGAGLGRGLRIELRDVLFREQRIGGAQGLTGLGADVHGTALGGHEVLVDAVLQDGEGCIIHAQAVEGLGQMEQHHGAAIEDDLRPGELVHPNGGGVGLVIFAFAHSSAIAGVAQLGVGHDGLHLVAGRGDVVEVGVVDQLGVALAGHNLHLVDITRVVGIVVVAIGQGDERGHALQLAGCHGDVGDEVIAGIAREDGCPSGGACQKAVAGLRPVAGQVTAHATHDSAASG